MQRLFLFVYRYRAFITFLGLEIICIWFIVQNNTYQSAKYFNSSNAISANLLATSQGVQDYFRLTEINQDLANQNARLLKKVEKYNQSLLELEALSITDSTVLGKYEYLPARVIKNSTRRFENYITINKGLNYGIEPGMAVIDNSGVVGKVKTVSKNHSVIISILHANSLVSSKIKRTGDLCTTQWDGESYQSAQVLYLPRHVKLQVGDTVVTSGYNSVFPEGVPVGVIESFDISEEALFFEVKLSLASDLNRLSYVYLVKNLLKIEQDSIETIIN